MRRTGANAWHIRHEPNQKFRNIFHLHFHEAAVCWDNFPYPLTNVSGSLDIYPDHWEFHEFQGTHERGHVLVNAWMESNVPGLFAAGAARSQSARQVITVAGDGATAALAADRFLHTGGE